MQTLIGELFLKVPHPCPTNTKWVPLHEVENHPLPDDLFFLRCDVILPLGLDDALAEVLEAGALGRRAANVDDPVQLALALGCLRQLKKKTAASIN